MGSWGTTIYSNDTAEDVRDACKEIFAYYDIKEGNRILFETFKDTLNQNLIDDDFASFWYALADWQWKHGMLTEQVKNKTLELLKSYAGIDDWIEVGNKKDISNRRRVLDNLKKQLQSDQPPFKKPKLHLARPKHKLGDIVIFKATEYVDEWDSTWIIENLRPPFMFESDLIANSAYENVKGYNAHGKYMAVICVGSQKEPHSEYLNNVFDEYSVYVWYNYLSSAKPTVKTLNSCGFLPIVKWRLKDFNQTITDSIFWVYKFILSSENFKDNRYIEFEKSKNNDISEVDRFNQLFLHKYYPNDYYHEQGDSSLTNMFYVAFEEKNRMELLNLTIDDLLNFKIKNPNFLSSNEIDKRYTEWVQRQGTVLK